MDPPQPILAEQYSWLLVRYSHPQVPQIWDPNFESRDHHVGSNYKSAFINLERLENVAGNQEDFRINVSTIKIK